MRLVLFIVSACLLPASSNSARAQDFPARTLTMVVPFAAGSGTDSLGRILAAGLSTELGRQVIVENVTGAGGMTGVARVAKANPDGYQFVFGTVGTFAFNQTLYKKPLYNTLTDLTPLALIADQSFIMVARRNFPADSLQDFISFAKANQAKMQYGSSGAGSGNHLSCALINAAAGIEVTHVPYRGGLANMGAQDLMAGRIDYMCITTTLTISLVANNTVKAIANLARTRSSALPDIATVHEQGFANFDASGWFAVYLPKATPQPIVEKLYRATISTLNSPSTKQRLREVGVDLVTEERRSPEYLRGFAATEIEKWARIIKATGVSMD